MLRYYTDVCEPISMIGFLLEITSVVVPFKIEEHIQPLMAQIDDESSLLIFTHFPLADCNKTWHIGIIIIKIYVIVTSSCSDDGNRRLWCRFFFTFF